MLKRVYDAKRFNAIINDPTVKPYVVYGDQTHLDASDVVNDRSNVLLMNEYGGIFFERISPVMYKAHTQFLPEGRGKKAIEASYEAIDYIFKNTPCLNVMAAIPAYNKASKLIARRVGFEYVDTDKEMWLQNGKKHDVDNFILTYYNWKTIDKR